MTLSLDEDSKEIVTQDLNNNPRKLQGHSGNLLVSLSRVAWLGWILFFVMVVAFLLQGFFYSLSTPIMATENGQIIGEIIYNEPYIRDDDQIKRSIKVWTEAYLVSNAATLDEDMSVSLSHTCPRLQKELIEEWRESDRYFKIKSQQLRTKVFWSQDTGGISLTHVRGEQYKAHVQGEVLNLDTNKSAQFNLDLSFELIKRYLKTPLGIEVCEAVDK